MNNFPACKNKHDNSSYYSTIDCLPGTHFTYSCIVIYLGYVEWKKNKGFAGLNRRNTPNKMNKCERKYCIDSRENFPNN